MSFDVVVPEALMDEIVAEDAASYDIVSKEDAATIIRGAMKSNSYRSLYELVEPYLDVAVQPKVLEIGSGNGLGLCYFLKRGVNAYGVEPGEGSFSGRYGRALRVLEANGIADAPARLLSATAEALPFTDGSFDIVASHAVLEHVRDVQSALLEAVRVTKPGGLIVMCMPNYNSFFEGHYRIPWLPYVLHSKARARWYVGRVWRRPVAFLDELNFTTPTWLTRLGRSLPDIEHTDTYYLSFSTLGHLSALHRALALRLYWKLGKLAWLGEAPLLGPGMLAASSLGANLVSALGLSPVFTVVFHKRRASFS